MNNRALWTCLSLAVCLTAISLWRATPVHGASPTSPKTVAVWNRQTAAAYLDSREVWWQQWPRAQKDHGTLCISCHTNVPYAMARPALRRELNETKMADPEKIMIDSVEKRVSHWSEMIPFYSDAANGPGKTAEAHATEAVLNAIILASYDAHQDHLRSITRTAFDAAWALQQTTAKPVDGSGRTFISLHGSPQTPPIRAQPSCSSKPQSLPITTRKSRQFAITFIASATICSSTTTRSP